jgi:iron complex transport system ATP-binding protein
MAPLIECRDVTVYRGDIRALDRLTLSIQSGEHVAILGPNGCGKSTLIKTLTRECYPAIEDPPSTLRIMGRERWDVSLLRSMLGIVTQDLITACTRGMSSDVAECPRRVTGRDTVLSGFFSSIGVWAHHHVTPEMARKADEPRPARDRAPGRSTARRTVVRRGRRLVIGRALVHDPAALVLDEVANSLDLRAAHQLREMTRAIAQAGTAVVIVTHHLPEVIPEIDQSHPHEPRTGRPGRPEGRDPDIGGVVAGLRNADRHRPARRVFSRLVKLWIPLKLPPP